MVDLLGHIESSQLLLMILSTVFWGSWANTFKGTKDYAFELFYWDYILGWCSARWYLRLHWWVTELAASLSLETYRTPTHRM